MSTINDNNLEGLQMGKRFLEDFSEVLKFEPDGLYLAKEPFTEEEALKKFRQWEKEYYGEATSKITDVVVGFVKYGFFTEDLREDLGMDAGWTSCSESDKNSQACWVIK